MSVDRLQTVVFIALAMRWSIARLIGTCFGRNWFVLHRWLLLHFASHTLICLTRLPIC